MKCKCIMLTLITVVMLSGCANNTEIKKYNEEVHNDAFTKIIKQNEKYGEQGTNELENNTEVENNTKVEENLEPLDPEDFRVDTEQRTPEEQMKEILTNNKDYIESKGLILDTLINMEWEYRATEDLYSVVAYDGTNFHAVVVSIDNNTIIIDPE